jgi:hypothetical protein
VTVALLALAGCSGAPGDRSPTANETVTIQPAQTATPTATQAVDFDRAPPGVSASGVRMEPLLRSHVQELRNRSHTITIRETWHSDSRQTTTSRVVRSGREGASVTRSYSPQPIRSIAWTNGSTTARRYSVLGNDTGARYQFNSSGIRVRSAAEQRRVIRLLTATNFSAVDSSERNDTVVTILESRSVPDNRTLQRVLQTTDVTRSHVRVAVRESGRVAALTWNATVRSRSGAVDLAYQYAVTDVGATTVPRPPWIETAKARATRLNASLDPNASHLRLEHRGGDPVPADAFVRWRTGLRDRPQNTQFGLRLEAKETAYAWIANGSIQFDRDPPVNRTTERLSRGLLLRFATSRGLPIDTVYGVPTRSESETSTPSSAD